MRNLISDWMKFWILLSFWHEQFIWKMLHGTISEKIHTPPHINPFDFTMSNTERGSVGIIVGHVPGERVSLSHSDCVNIYMLKVRCGHGVSVTHFKILHVYQLCIWITVFLHKCFINKSQFTHLQVTVFSSDISHTINWRVLQNIHFCATSFPTEWNISSCLIFWHEQFMWKMMHGPFRKWPTITTPLPLRVHQIKYRKGEPWHECWPHSGKMGGVSFSVFEWCGVPYSLTVAAQFSC